MKEVVRVANGVGSEDAVSILHVKVPEHHHQALTLAPAVSLLQTLWRFSYFTRILCNWSAWQRGKQGNHADPPEQLL